MKFDENINCETCKYGYFLDYSDDGYHNLCGAGECYLCARLHNKCDFYEQGNIPEGSERVKI
jgi:hypothetical protein